MHAFDRKTDGQTDSQTTFSSLDRVCIACSAVKMPSTVEGKRVHPPPQRIYWLRMGVVIKADEDWYGVGASSSNASQLSHSLVLSRIISASVLFCFRI